MTNPPHQPISSRKPVGPSGHDLATEVLRLRERFAAYERMDRQLDEMVTGLTDLLRGATELRQRTNQDITEALARCETLIATDRIRQRETLTGLQGELHAAQQRTGELNRALDHLSGRLTAIAGKLSEATDGSLSPNGTVAASPAPSPATTTRHLAIRDVPSVATALTVQRAIAGLSGIAAIQTREFAAGELRLQLEVVGPIALADLPPSSEGSLEAIEDDDERLILRFVPALVTA